MPGRSEDHGQPGMYMVRATTCAAEQHHIRNLNSKKFDGEHVCRVGLVAMPVLVAYVRRSRPEGGNGRRLLRGRCAPTRSAERLPRERSLPLSQSSHLLKRSAGRLGPGALDDSQMSASIGVQ
jgi:hypothetical protein